MVHLPNMTDTRGDELKVVGLSVKVVSGETLASLPSPCRRVWSGTGAQATLSPLLRLGIKNPITSPVIHNTPPHYGALTKHD